MKLKSVIGIVLIIASVFGMYLWETKYRDKMLLTEVLVAREDLAEGQIVSSADFKTLSVTTDSLISGALTQKDASELAGKICAVDIKAKAQLSFDMFVSEEELNPEGSHTLVIPTDWIYLKNYELTAGDRVEIFLMPEQESLGTFTVKRTDPEDDEYIEIQATLEEYFNILDSMGKDGTLLIVSERSL